MFKHNQVELDELDLYSFVITGPLGGVLDFGTYLGAECCRATAHDSPHWRVGNRFTFVRHDEDGSSDVTEVLDIRED